MKEPGGRLVGAVVILCLFRLAPVRAAQGGHAGPARVAPARDASEPPTWKDRVTWRGRPSPLEPMPEKGGPSAQVAALERNRAIVDEGLRLIDDGVRDPVRNHKALVDAFEDFVLLQEAWSSGVDSWIKGIEQARKEKKDSDANRYTQGLAQKLRMALLRRFDAMVKGAERSGVDLSDRTKVSGATRALAEEASRALAREARDWWVELLGRDFNENLGKFGSELPPEVKSKLDELSNDDVKQLLDLMGTYENYDYRHSKGQELLTHPGRLTPATIHELHKRFYRPFKLPYEVLPPFGDNLKPLVRRSNLKEAMHKFTEIEKTLRENPVTRKRLAEEYDTYMKQTTGRSLTEIFREKGLELDYLSGMDDRWLILNAMKRDLIGNLSPARRGSPPTERPDLDWYGDFCRDADRFLPRLKSETPQWGDPATYDGRPTPFLEPAPKPAPGMTRKDYEARARAQIARETRSRGYIGPEREHEIWVATMQPWKSARKAAQARNDAALRVSSFASGWAVSYVNQKGISRKELVRLFDGLYAARFGKSSSLSAEWEGEDLDQPATATERENVWETVLQYTSEVNKAALASKSAWGYFEAD